MLACRRVYATAVAGLGAGTTVAMATGRVDAVGGRAATGGTISG